MCCGTTYGGQAPGGQEQKGSRKMNYIVLAVCLILLGITTYLEIKGTGAAFFQKEASSGGYLDYLDSGFYKWMGKSF